MKMGIEWLHDCLPLSPGDNHLTSNPSNVSLMIFSVQKVKVDINYIKKKINQEYISHFYQAILCDCESEILKTIIKGTYSNFNITLRILTKSISVGKYFQEHPVSILT